jgi:uncharacterized cupredoxin-like copper-binding protein
MIAMRHTIAGFGLAIALAFISGTALGATTINVELNNTSPLTDMPTTMAYGTPGMDQSKSPMQIKLSAATAKAGLITFKVKNSSKETVHEMIVAVLKEPGKQLPYRAADSEVDEKKITSKGEVSELDPGKSGTLSVNLPAGKYLLMCNVAGHFAAGMWVGFTVTK